MCEGNVVALPRRPNQAERIAERITRGVDLGAQPISRPAQALGIRPPFFRARASGMLMRPHDGRIDHQPFQIGFARKSRQHVIENAHLNPAIVTPFHRLIVAQPLRQITPAALGIPYP
jgi:hypothetical protein